MRYMEIQIQIVSLGFFVPYLSTTVQTRFPEGGDPDWAGQKSCGETVRQDEGEESSGGSVVLGVRSERGLLPWFPDTSKKR